MNLHALTAPYITPVNPWTVANYGMSTGSETFPDGTQAPSWVWYPGVMIQAQPLKNNELMHVAGMNLQKENMAVYMNGNIQGADRLGGRGGDMLQFFGRTWLVTGVIENWDADGWTKIAVTEQMPPS